MHPKSKLKTQDSELCSVEILDVALPDCYGVARVGDLVVFVPGAITGDRVSVETLRRDKRYSFGRIVEIEEPSPFRVSPHCPHFGQCGGCGLQHLAYPKQLEIKENHLKQALRRIGSIDSSLLVSPIVPSPDQYFYRTKLELAFGETEGRVVLGQRERISPFHEYRVGVIPLETCSIFGAASGRLIRAVTEFVRSQGLKAYDPVRKKGFLRHLVLREAKGTGDMMAIVETAPGRLPDSAGLWKAMTDAVPQMKSLYRGVNGKDGDLIRYDRLEHLHGESCIEEQMGQWRFRIHPASFFQPNGAGALLLYERIAEAAGLTGVERVLGLYCGMAPIEIHLSGRAKAVTGIDSLPDNIANARENCLINNVGNCTFIEGDVEKVLGFQKGGSFDIAITDPPRGGISGRGIESIVRLGVPRVIYVSCNPATLARDLKLFGAKGYVPYRIVPFDFFPHTGHMETLVVLTRRDK